MRLFQLITALVLLSLTVPSCGHSQPVQPVKVSVADTLKPWQRRPDSIPTTYFDPPLQRPVSLSGSFAEPRSNHFHGGIDLRIGGEVGENVYAPADGWVSRVKVSPWGGGKTLYITHPNGIRTVYMHLDDFCGEMANYVLSFQYSHHTFVLDEEFPVGKYPVRRGQLIAHAGNTGGSGGPHLHYETRYAYNDEPFNPLYLGLPYSDAVLPVVRGVRVYGADGKAVAAKAGQTVNVPAGRCYLGICASDVSETGTTGRNGIESIELYCDDSLFWTYCVRSYLYEETRAINAIIDYAEYRRSGMAYFLSRRLRGDPSPHSRPVSADGYLTLALGEDYNMRYVVRDTKGNATEMAFTIHAATPSLQAVAANTQAPAGVSASVPVTYFKKTQLRDSSFQAVLEANTAYDNDWLDLSEVAYNNMLSVGYKLRLRVNDLPPSMSYTIRIAAPPAGSALRDRMIIVHIDGSKTTALATRREGDWLVANPRVFGTFAVTSDTEAPKCRPVNFATGKPVNKNDLRVKITDNLSGIEDYNCYINGQWVLAEFDGKTATLIMSPRSFLHQGNNTLRVVLHDAAGNETVAEYNILAN